MNKISIIVGKRIRNYRTSQHLSQEELAELCGMHPTYIGQLERGEKNATLETVERVARALKISLSVLFEKAEEINNHDNHNYSLSAYNLMQEFSETEQEKLYLILKTAAEFKDMK